MENLAILSEALEQMGFDLSGLTPEDVFAMQDEIEKVVNSYVSQQE